jgi:hypothetical protein
LKKWGPPSEKVGIFQTLGLDFLYFETKHSGTFKRVQHILLCWAGWGVWGMGGGAIFETLKIFTTLFYCFSIISPVFWPNVRLNLPNFLLPSCPCPVRLCLYYFYWVSYSALPYFVSLNTRLWTIISSSIFVSPRWWKKKRRNTEQTDANNGYLFIYLKFFIHGSLSTSVLLKIYRVFW